MAYASRLGKQARRLTSSRRAGARSMQYRANRGAQSFRANRSRFSRVLGSTASRGSHAEVKLVDTVNGSATQSFAINQTGTIVTANLIVAGSGFNNRVGRRVSLQAIHVTGVITQTGTGNAANDYGRIVVVYDRQPNGALPAISTILLSYDQTSSTYTTAWSGVNPDQRERFAILADEHLALPGASTAASALTGGVDATRTVFNINRYIALRGLLTHFQHDSSPAVIGDIATGAIYVFTLGGNAAGAEAWKAVLSWRLRYKDT